MTDDLSAEEEFAVLINKVMAKGVQDDADPDAMARICLNTARELYDHYGAGDDDEHHNYLEYVVDAQFQQAEIEEWLDDVEGRTWTNEA